MTTTTSIADLDVEAMRPDVVSELLRQAEMRQSAVLQASMGMGQRASVIGAGLIAAAGALAAAGNTANDLRVPAMSACICLVVSACYCLLACRPQKFRFPGIEPREWAGQEFLANSLHAIQFSQIIKLDKHLARNEEKQARNGRNFRNGLLVAASSPVVAASITALISAPLHPQTSYSFWR